MTCGRGLVLVLALGAAALAACGYQGPPLAGYPGLQLRVLNYYDGRGWEQGANCINPQMGAITVVRVVEDTPAKLVLDLRYWYQSDDFGDRDIFFRPFSCRGWNQRTFVINKSPGGRLDVVGMSGPQRSLH
jgi:hypothetical protein